MLANPDFNNEMDFAPYQEFDIDDEQQFEDFMSGDWAWQQAVSHPIILTLFYSDFNCFPKG
jgi:hypothetical protein